jgi:hypothetical protein
MRKWARANGGGLALEWRASEPPSVWRYVAFLGLRPRAVEGAS